jgi:hypothetical protein
MLGDLGGELPSRQRRPSVEVALHLARPRRDPGPERHRVDEPEVRHVHALEQMRAQDDRATDVVADQCRALEAPLVDEFGEHRSVRDERDVLINVTLRVTESEQVPNVDPVTFGENGRHLAPHQ